MEPHDSESDINLVEPAAMDEEYLSRFHSELGLVFGFVKYSNDRKALADFISRNPDIKGLSKTATSVIKKCTHRTIR